MTDPTPTPRGASSTTADLLREPLVWLLVALTAGLVVIRAHHTRVGLAIIAGAVAAAALLRLALSPRAAGLLVVRTRGFDVAALAAMAGGLAALAVLVPFPPGTG
ncbi:MAG: hypothetical protein QOK42_1320 [Frankiaceae bacterium]|nr:hypothetical protein [Frankiaceae bacterium]